MKKIYLIAGHEGKGTGARSLVPEHTSFFLDEGDETITLQKYIEYHLKSKFHTASVADDPRSSLFNVISWLKAKIGFEDIIVDLHFNAFSDAGAHGTEVLIPTVSSKEEQLLAQNLLRVITITLGTYPRGVFDETRSPHKRLGMLSGPSQATNVLIEICFCTNQDDVAKYYKNRMYLAEKIAEILYYHASK